MYDAQGSKVMQEPETLPIYYSYNVTDYFLTWFMIGFILQLVSIGGSCLGLIGAGIRN